MFNEPQAAIVIITQYPIQPPYFRETVEGKPMFEELNRLLEAEPSVAHRTMDSSEALSASVLKQVTSFWTLEPMLRFAAKNKEFLYKLYSAAEKHFEFQGKTFILEFRSGINSPSDMKVHQIRLERGPEAFVLNVTDFV